MKLDDQKKYYDVESQWKEHNTGVKGFNDGLNETFRMNIEKARKPLDKWEELKYLIKGRLSWPVHYSHSKEYENGEMNKVLEWMEYLEKKESKDIATHVQKMAVEETKQEGFLFTSIPTFDQKAWEKILEQKGLQGLS